MVVQKGLIFKRVSRSGVIPDGDIALPRQWVDLHGGGGVDFELVLHSRNRF